MADRVTEIGARGGEGSGSLARRHALGLTGASGRPATGAVLKLPTAGERLGAEDAALDLHDDGERWASIRADVPVEYRHRSGHAHRCVRGPSQWDRYRSAAPIFDPATPRCPQSVLRCQVPHDHGEGGEV